MAAFFNLLDNTAQSWGSCPVCIDGCSDLTWQEVTASDGLFIVLLYDFAHECKIKIVPFDKHEGMLETQALPLPQAPANTIHLHLVQDSVALCAFKVLNIKMPHLVFIEFMVWFKKQYDLAILSPPQGLSFLNPLNDGDFYNRRDVYLDQIMKSRQKLDVIQ